MTQQLADPSVAKPKRPKRANGLGIASLILGILAFVGSFIPFLNYGTGFLAALGLVLGIVGLFLRDRAKGMAIAGTILNATALVLSIILAVVYTASFATSVSSSMASDSAAAAKPEAVAYSVTGAAKSADIIYDDNSGGSQQVTGTKLPWKTAFTTKTGGSFDFKTLNVIATNGADDKGTITCSISIAGKVVQTKSSKGAFASVTCDASGFKG